MELVDYESYATGGEGGAHQWTNELMAQLEHSVNDTPGPSFSQSVSSLPQTATTATTTNTENAKKSRYKAKKRRPKKPKNTASGKAATVTTTTTTTTGADSSVSTGRAVEEGGNQQAPKKKRKRGRQNSSANKELHECTNRIASKLEEKNRPAIQKAVEVLGTEVAKELLQETLRIQGRGGMFVEDGTRKRTKGGVYFLLLKDRVTNENYQYIFSHNKERDKKRKKRQVERAKKSATSNGGTAGDRDTSENKTPVNSSDAQPSIFKTQKSLNEILGMEEGEIASF